MSCQMGWRQISMHKGVKQMEYSNKIYEILEKMETNRQEAQKYYAQLGEKYYKSHPDNEPAEFAEEYRQIRELEADNRHLEELIDREMQMKTCPGCGEKIPLETVYCPYCRTSTIEIGRQSEPAQPDDSRTCSNCGHVNKGGGKFCMNCGKPLV